MREDIVGMLKNAIERGGRPERVAQSLIGSGYNPAEVQQALAYVTGGTLSSLNAPPPQQTIVRPIQQPVNPYPQMPAVPMPIQTPPAFQPRQWPTMAYRTGPGSGKLIFLIFLLFFLVSGLVAAIIFKDNLLGLLD